MKYTSDSLNEAFCSILGREVVEALLRARISPPEICGMSAKIAFIDEIDNRILRQALTDLCTIGQFNYQDVSR